MGSKQTEVEGMAIEEWESWDMERGGRSSEESRRKARLYAYSESHCYGYQPVEEAQSLMVLEPKIRHGYGGDGRHCTRSI